MTDELKVVGHSVPRVDGLAQGTRGNGSQAYASRMWGVTAEEYMRIADPWPMNPDGELLFGLKIENPRADANVETSVRVPGIHWTHTTARVITMEFIRGTKVTDLSPLLFKLALLHASRSGRHTVWVPGAMRWVMSRA